MNIALTNFQKDYNGVSVLAIESLRIDDGVYWLKGGNGSGKSTFLKTIAGILHFDGNIILNNQYDIRRSARAYRRLVNFAEAEPVFPEFLTGMELVRLFAEAKGAADGMELVYLESMKMLSYIDQPVGTYSSGMIKKLSLVLAFLGTPELILLDEPMITLDADALDVLAEWINVRHQKDNVSFLLASHQPFSERLRPLICEMEIVDKQVRITGK